MVKNQEGFTQNQPSLFILQTISKKDQKWNTYQSLNLRIKNLAQRDNQLIYIDISPTLLRPNLKFYPGLWKDDDLHLNQGGYDRWAAWIRPILKLDYKL